ncbi:MAG: IclR family transcriptional regulator [Firmicutes bacterium]|nr:IclR family transcriptional regulator [Bacillota bacterium]
MLDTFTIERPELALSELATACGLHPSTARRLLLTCEAVEWIAQDPVTRKYRLGMKLFELGHRAGEGLELPKIARPHLKRLVEETQESAYLAVMDRTEVLYLNRVESPQAVRLTSSVGQRLPAHSTGTGKVFLAHLSPQALDDFLSRPLTRYTTKTITDPTALRQELEGVRTRGYATTLEEHLEGTFSVAAPIFGPRGALIAALGMSGPSYRITDELFSEFSQIMISVAQAISTAMGGRVGT